MLVNRDLLVRFKIQRSLYTPFQQLLIPLDRIWDQLCVRICLYINLPSFIVPSS